MQVFRTPVVHRNGTSPVWNWQLHLRLPAAIPSADGADSEPVLRDDLLRFSVLNAAPIGEPDALCSGQVGATVGHGRATVQCSGPVPRPL